MQEATTSRAIEGTSAVDAHWQKLRLDGDLISRTWLVEHYLPFARILAASLYKRRADDSVPFDDFLQYARVGLLEAVDRFQPNHGVMFERFAVHRIRGAVLNGLGSESELAAQRAARTAAPISDRLESLGEACKSDKEHELLDHWVGKVVSLAFGVLLEREQDELVDESVSANPYARVELLHLRRCLTRCVDQLPMREAEVVRMHYYEHLEFQLIAAMFSISKGRVSQLHASALTRLRTLVADQGFFDKAL